MRVVVLKLSSFPTLKAIVARSAYNHVYDVVMLVDTAVRNLFTQKNLQSHRALK